MYRNLRNNLFYFIFRILIKFQSIKLTAFLIRISLRKLKSINNKNLNKKLIILEKSMGIDDIKISFQKSKIKHQPYVLQRKIFRIIFYQFLKGVDDHYYITNNTRKENNKKALREFYSEVLKELLKKFKFDIMINFNWLYAAERELQSACRKVNIKFITNQKESNFLEGEKSLYIKWFKKKIGKYDGNLILAYSKRYADFLIETKVVKKNQVKVIGIPRADKFFDKGLILNQKHVLFFLIQSQRGIFKPNKKALKLWEQITTLSLKSTLKIAKNYPNIKFIFKSKNINTTDMINQIKLIKSSKLENCHIVKGGDSFEYIKDSKVIIAFNSMSILEGIACRKKIIVPHFNINTNFKKGNVMKLSKPVIISKNAREFKINLEKIITNKPYKIYLDKQSKNLLNYHMGNSDGKSHKRFADTINQI